MSSSALIELINGCVQDVECLPAYSTTSDSFQDTWDKCMQLEASATPNAAVWTELIDNMQVRIVPARPRFATSPFILLQPSIREDVDAPGAAHSRAVTLQPCCHSC